MNVHAPAFYVQSSAKSVHPPAFDPPPTTSTVRSSASRVRSCSISLRPPAIDAHPPAVTRLSRRSSARSCAYARDPLALTLDPAPSLPHDAPVKKRRRRPRLPQPQGLDGILDRAGENRFARSEVPVPPRIWREAVGGRIADRAEPIALAGGVLTVRAATSVWANELSMLSTTLIARLNERRVAVKELRFRVGPIQSALRPPERRVSRAVPAPAPIPADLARELLKIEDDELRRDIANAASRSLAWRAHVTPPASTEAPRAARAPLSAETESDRRGRK